MKQLLRATLPTIVLLLSSLIPAAAQASKYTFEQTAASLNICNTSVQFQVKVFSMVPIVGHFGDFLGSLANHSDWESESVHIQMHIDVNSINTENDTRDDFLRGATFFDTKRYPKILFTSTHLINDENGRIQIIGEMTLHGTTRPVVFNVTQVDLSQPFVANNFHASTTIKRSDFGLDSMWGIVGDEVEIIITMQTN